MTYCKQHYTFLLDNARVALENFFGARKNIFSVPFFESLSEVVIKTCMGVECHATVLQMRINAHLMFFSYPQNTLQMCVLLNDHVNDIMTLLYCMHKGVYCARKCGDMILFGHELV